MPLETFLSRSEEVKVIHQSSRTETIDLIRARPDPFS
jgi:hypothetical protein